MSTSTRSLRKRKLDRHSPSTAIIKSEEEEPNLGRPSRRRRRAPPNPTIKREEEVLERIAPDGDVIFVLGGKKLLVQSSVLKNASSVFSASLAAGSNEFRMMASAASNGEVAEIPLPDDFDAFKLICLVIHHQGNTKHHDPSINKLVRIFQVARKYQLMDAISVSFDFWAKRKYVAYEPDVATLWLLAVMYLLVEDQEHFQLLTRLLIFEHKGSFITLAAQSEAKDMTDGMYSFFRKHRFQDEDIGPYVLPFYRHLGEVFMQDDDNTKPGLYSVGMNWSIADLLEQIKAFEIVPPKFSSRNESDEGEMLNSMYKLLMMRLSNLERDFKGLCLHCFHRGSWSISVKESTPRVLDRFA
ncbi:btb poz [Fusarium albosuccineum]|uniref:Btb poz n=1 Tax=Fusarium albosuccineum TaxID=1237068 RepID=A0A8H4L193_9HYPO|nr:btb poz [Fusarium albosuccineum]